MVNITRPIQQLLGVFLFPKKFSQEDEETIKVHSVVGKAAYLYEKVRNAIDYKEEHLIRKQAIHRIIKRKFLVEHFLLNEKISKTSRDLIQELIRARYLENNKMAISKIQEVEIILNKYNFLTKRIKQLKSGKELRKTLDWFWQLAACELEDNLVDKQKDLALIQSMFKIINPKIKLASENISEKEKEIQVYIAINRSLIKSDDYMISYLLVRSFYQGWKNSDHNVLENFINNFDKVRVEIDEQLNHPWRYQLLKFSRKQAVSFWFLRDLIESKGDKVREILVDKVVLKEEVNKVCQKKYQELKKKLRRGVVRSIIYVFITKMSLALVLEIPIDLYFEKAVNYFSLIINIAFPPLLMLLVSLTIKKPNKKNTEAINEAINKIVYGEKGHVFVLKQPVKRGSFLRILFNLIYAFTFILSVYVLFILLSKINFNIFSIGLFVFFLTLVSFFGIRIRKPIEEVRLIKSRESILTIVVDFLALPFVQLGHFMSIRFQKLNVFAFFLDFFIEAPFKLLVELIEDLFNFIGEKKEEIMD